MSRPKSEVLKTRWQFTIDPELAAWAKSRAKEVGISASAFLSLLISQEKERVEDKREKR